MGERTNFYDVGEDYSINKNFRSLDKGLHMIKPGNLEAFMPWKDEDKGLKDQLKGLLEIIKKYGNKGECSELIEARNATRNLIKTLYKERSGLKYPT